MTTSKESEYMIIEALEDDFSVLLDGESDYDARIEYSIDGETWNDLKGNQTTTPVSNGTLLLFRGKYTYNANVPTHFSISKRCNLKGNCMALLGDKYAIRNKTLGGKARAFYNLFFGCTGIINVDENFLPATTLVRDCYHYMFRGCSSLVTAPALPATTLATDCYKYMFSGCTSLTAAPALPATTLASRCYQYMFQGCTNLTAAPELPATTLAESCYSYMFKGCTSLTTAPDLPATTLANNCYYSMFSGCTSLTTAPDLPATTLAGYCYQYMFKGCTSLTTAPALPATTLAWYCYYSMFDGCSKLNYIKMLAADISASSCLYNWVNGVSSTGTFVKHPDMTTLTTGTSGIPSGWTVVNDGEE